MERKILYKAICEQVNDLPVFLQHWWLDAVSDNWDVAIAYKGEEITGVWPYHIDVRLGVRILRNPVLTPYLGPHIFYPNDLRPINRDSYEHEVLLDLLKDMPDEKVWKLSIAPRQKQAGLFKEYGLKIGVQQTFLIDLSEEVPTIYSTLKDSLRRHIRAGEKDIEIISDDACLSDLHHFHWETLHRKGKGQAFTIDRMKKLMAACLLHNSGDLWVARVGQNTEAIVWNVWDMNNSYYFIGAKNPESNNTNAISLLLWNAIVEAKKRGNKCFDLEGSMDQGVERLLPGLPWRTRTLPHPPQKHIPHLASGRAVDQKIKPPTFSKILLSLSLALEL